MTKARGNILDPIRAAVVRNIGPGNIPKVESGTLGNGHTAMGGVADTSRRLNGSYTSH